MSSPYLSEIRLFSFGFAPLGWAQCNGQLLPINQNQALFSLLGTNFGGNGQTTFGLPDFRSRVPIAMGSGPGLSPYTIGQIGGIETETLALTEMPAHTHAVVPSQLAGTAPCKGAVGNQRGPGGNVHAVEYSDVTAPYSNATPDGVEASGTIVPAITAAAAGGSQPHENRQPYLTLNYCIALQGIFPSQS